ncbi:ATP-binding protein [Pelotalea chapellei]|uniref:histidine kinase n=1 Tax=Pelotalea chapellei TaxID=44671 RepID=A0ABS5UAJ7_9BACT|nr:ATP-binding protein [Pelotalea chapellei]MBT1072709.1 PAS domain S-box protein [Pelotalea chapellei]
MVKKLPPSKISREGYLLLLLLICAGFIGNYCAVRLFIGFNYLFGSIFVLLVVRLYGVRWGLLAGVIASSWTMVLFGHPYAMVWLCGEPLFVGWLLSRSKSRNIILCDSLYWPLIGAPLLWMFFRYVMMVPLLGTVTALMMYWVIGISNALVASLLLTSFPRLTAIVESDETHSTPIHQLIFNLMMAFVMIPAIIILIIQGRDFEKRFLHGMYDELENNSRIALYELRLLQKQEGGESVSGAQLNKSLRDMLLVARRQSFHEITLLDGAGKVITSTAKERLSHETFDFCPDGEISSVTDNGIQHCLPRVTSTLPLWQRVQRSSYLVRLQVGSDTGWTIVVDTPFAPYQRLLFKDHRRALLVVLSLNMLILVTSLYTSRRLAAPLRHLSRLTTDLPERLLKDKLTSWPVSTVAEIEQLSKNFQVMADALSQKFQEIFSAKEQLEQRVGERTQELSRTNSELQHEIQERKLTERQRDHLMDELVSQVHFLQTLIDALPNPVFYKDINGLYQGCNKAFEKSWGVTREELVGKTVHQLFPAAVAEVFHKADLELFERCGVQVFEAKVPYASGGTHDGIFYKATFNDSRGELAGLIGTVVDINDRKRAEAERDRLMQELRHKNKELEGIVYIVSHDLRTPLVNIQGFSRKLGKSCKEVEQLVESLELPTGMSRIFDGHLQEDIPKSLGFIASSIEKMDGLLNGLSRLSRLGQAALNFETLDMRLILEKIVSSMAFQLEKAGARIELYYLHDCNADAGQVIQVFSNLLDNALKYRSAERPLVIKVYSVQFAESVRYCVEDNGIGIAREHQMTIWDIFQRLNPTDTVGQGLGLTMSRRIIDRLGGSIWVESEPEAGSCFYVVLPAAETDKNK